MEIGHNTTACRIEANENGHTAYIEYRIRDGIMNILHTRVPREIEGKGIATELTKYALEYARKEGLKIIPSCSYSKVYIERNKQYQDLLF